MGEYEVLFYEDRDGGCPTDEFLAGLPVKVQAKVSKWMEMLSRYGPNLPRPYADSVRDKIRELRLGFGGMQYRFLYFFHGRMIVVTHGFVKKTAEVPEGEIARAQRLRSDFYQQLEGGEIRP